MNRFVPSIRGRYTGNRSSVLMLFFHHILFWVCLCNFSRGDYCRRGVIRPSNVSDGSNTILLHTLCLGCVEIWKPLGSSAGSPYNTRITPDLCPFAGKPQQNNDPRIITARERNFDRAIKAR